MLKRLTHKGPRKRLSCLVLFFLFFFNAEERASLARDPTDVACFFRLINKTLIPLDVGPSREQVISVGARGADLLSVTSAVETDKAVSASP